MNIEEMNQLDWQKMNGLLPAIVQNVRSGEVLMLAYMNQDALRITLESKQLTFYSRSKQRLWRKGETSGNIMTVQAIVPDCDGDSLLVQAIPTGPACHLGFTTCFQPAEQPDLLFLNTLVQIICNRAQEAPPNSYSTSLIESGVERCAQKVGEEAVETAIAAVSGNRQALITETADLLFHLLVLLQSSNVDFYEVVACLTQRHKDSSGR